ncbi:dGTP triphosphohydrolase [Asticcacaulis machinosus]|uniref:Deoxyguanosinetriphosphate triphosphohydrolase-like protein n=1 Tax=Asticcacaulis machinosus TaxID=2984211 RepID=A0ABT5HH30_9CAUL|nr:dNTP triphosphohydrolase [Asticcacaulis machinosus]MDC7675498.1 dNTP triphosphohydrolase [Asticcacaulis machinosus]
MGREEVGSSEAGGREKGCIPANDSAGNSKNERKSNDLKPLYAQSDRSRELEEPVTERWRSDTRRDYARVIHSPAFRRLQGKTQLFPGHESDFFRNRLTHSLEVAQIAESIAYMLNEQHDYFKDNPIDTTLCALAGLVHDLGHPPFGHNGEHALDDKMRAYGGFEGNAQTFRILSRLEKKKRSLNGDDIDDRLGLNLTYRSLASILKYDREIPNIREESDGLVKGYYSDDAELVSRVKLSVAPDFKESGGFKTIECAIMDLADDIAYSTYDLEDSLKAGFLTPASILSSDQRLLERVAEKVGRSIETSVDSQDVLDVFFEIFQDIATGGAQDSSPELAVFNIVKGFEQSRGISENGYLRTELTSQLVGEFISGVRLKFNDNFPNLSKVYLEKGVRRKVETLKNYTFEATIFSTRLKVAEYRGYEVVSRIFEALAGPKGYLLMPDDVRGLWLQFEANASARMRVVCDFVAGMTDRYALEFYARLHSDNPQSIFKPI